MTYGNNREDYGNYHYILSDEQVVELLSTWYQNKYLLRGDPRKLTYKDMMKKYNICKNTFYKIVNRRSYQWIKTEVKDGKLVRIQ